MGSEGEESKLGDVLLETRTAYLSLKGTSHSLVRTRHRSRSAPRAAPAAAGRRPPAAHGNGTVLLLRNVELDQTE